MRGERLKMNFFLNTEENFLKETKNKKILCFGAGHILERFLRESKEWNMNIEYIVDNDIKKQGTYIDYCNRKIQIQSIDSLDFAGRIILITSTAVCEIKNQIKDKGIEGPFFFYPFLEPYPDGIDKQKRIRLDVPAMKMLNQYCKEFCLQESQTKYWAKKLDEIFLKGGIVLPYITALITSKCTLRCRDCNNLIPYCLNGKLVEKETVINSVNKICDAVDYCICMNITGGEPFLHQNLDEIIDAIVENDKILFVEIITNGTIIPPSKVLKSMKNQKVIVKISEYKEYSKTDELKQVLNHEGINFLVNDNLQWVASGGIERRNKEYDRIKYEYLTCWAGKFCKAIYNGELYACARAAFLHAIGASNHHSDYIEIDGASLKERLLEFYLQEYVDACDFCDHADLEGKRIIKPAVQC